MYGGRIYLEFKSILWKRCERQFYKVAFRKCCDDIDEGFAYDWKRAVRRQFLLKLIFDKNFVCESSISMRNLAVARKEVCNKKLKKGDVIGVEIKHGKRVIKWMDKRQVLMMTSKSDHFDVLVSTGRKNRLNEDIEKPMAVIENNNAKKGVDISDQMLSYCTCVRKTMRWYKKFSLKYVLGLLL